jgi:hypothetical protein
MSSDLSDLPPFARELADASSVPDVLGDVVGSGVLNVLLPARPGTAKARLSKLSEPVRVSRQFFVDAVNAAWLLWLRGEGVTAEGVQRVASATFGVDDLDVLADVVASAKFVQALDDRGVVADRVEAEGLSAEMVACIRALSDPQPGLTVRSRLKGAGVSWEQFQGWLGFGPFREALTRASERGLKGAVALANAKLVESVDQGDLKSVQYLHELTGYFTPGRQQTLDTQQLVRDVMTVVLRRVTDPGLLLELAGDFRVLQERMFLGGDGAGSGERGAIVAGFGDSPGIVDVDAFVDSEDV